MIPLSIREASVSVPVPEYDAELVMVHGTEVCPTCRAMHCFFIVTHGDPATYCCVACWQP